MFSSGQQFIFTCEHGGNKVPADLQWLFENEKELLNTHRGYDPGALSLARLFAKRFAAPLFYSEVTRLLIELNRSENHQRLFSKQSKKLSVQERQNLIATMYLPYRQSVFKAIQAATDTAQVIHISIHSFTPVMDGKTRSTDIGLLFDPARKSELQFCENWKSRLKQSLPNSTIHFNRPYRGTSDGFTTALRTRFSDDQYVGIELEVNQKFVQDKPAWTNLQKRIVASLKELV